MTWGLFKLVIAISSGDSPVCWGIIHTKPSVIMLANFAVVLVEYVKLILGNFSALAQHPGQAGCYKAKTKSAVWLNIRSMQFSCCQSSYVFIDFEKGCPEPPPAGFSTCVCIHVPMKVPPPPRPKQRPQKGAHMGR